jgi:hypothetical protein
MRKSNRFGADHLESHYLKKIANSVGQGSVITHGYDPNGDEHIYLNGKIRKSFEEACDALGVDKTWKFLRELRVSGGNGVAFGVKSDLTTKGR